MPIVNCKYRRAPIATQATEPFQTVFLIRLRRNRKCKGDVLKRVIRSVQEADGGKCLLDSDINASDGTLIISLQLLAL